MRIFLNRIRASRYYDMINPGDNPLSVHIGHKPDWHDILAQSITNAEEVAAYLPVAPSRIRSVISQYPMRINPYYLSLLTPAKTAMMKQVVPDIREIQNDSLEKDPLGEESQSPVPHLIHRYPDRVLLMVSNQCAVYCRFCMRKRHVGKPFIVSEKTIHNGIAYINNNGSVREVILSGGDPLLLEDEDLNTILNQIRSIRHIDIIRIHTRIPSVLPHRITPALVETIRQYHPVYMMIHFNHPDEITPDSSLACAMLADAGIPLGSQTVLLKDINNDASVMKRLMRNLVRIRVKPYALYHPDPVRGTGHFRVPMDEGLGIMKNLRGYMSGVCVPNYMVDLPRGGGKIPIIPEYRRTYGNDTLIIENYEGDVFAYPDNSENPLNPH